MQEHNNNHTDGKFHTDIAPANITPLIAAVMSHSRNLESLKDLVAKGHSVAAKMEGRGSTLSTLPSK